MDEKKNIRSFSKAARQAEEMLHLSPGKITKEISYSWQSPEACLNLDQTAKGIGSILWKFNQMNETNLFRLAQTSPLAELEIRKMVKTMGFLYSLLLSLDKRLRNYTDNFAKRAPKEFLTWMTQREEDSKKSRLQVVK